MTPTAPVLLFDPAADAAAARAERAAAVEERWHLGEPADALAVLTADPELAADRPLALELAYEEFCLRREAGQRVDPRHFADRFPFAASLLRLVAVHSLLDKHPELLPNARPAVRYHPGDELGDYRVVRPLGHGGFADVYLARDLSTGGRAVVLKVSARSGGEADTLGRLAHPHLMPVWSAPGIDGERVLVMPFLGVATLEDLLPPTPAERAARPPGDRVAATAAARRPDDPAYTPTASAFALPGGGYERDVLAVAAGVASALAHLHANGVAHRDVKPSNVLLGPTGHPYLLDLNLAAATGGAARMGGTVPYLAPEVLSAPEGSPLDGAAADVFSFGVVLWELLAGRHPYLIGSEFDPAADPRQLIQRVADLQRAAPYRTARPPRVSRAVWAAVERCLSANPAERPTAADLARLFAPRPRRFVPRAVTTGVLAVASATAVWAALPANRMAPVEQPQPTVPFERGVLLHEQGRWVEAAVEFMKAGEESRSGHAYACAAYCYARNSLPQNALMCANRAEELGYSSADLDANRAYCHMQSGNLPAALIECDRALERDQNCHAARFIRAKVRIRQREVSQVSLDRQVIADCEMFTASGAVSSEGWLLAAKAHVLQPDRTSVDLDEAVNAVRQAVQSGATPAKIRSTKSLHDVLAAHPNYPEALTGTPGVSVPSENFYLVFPLPD